MLGDFRQKILLSLPPATVAKGPFRLGTVLYESPKWPFGLREEELLQNVSIFGRSGAGKTNVCFQLLLELSRLPHLPIGEVLRSVTVSWANIFDTGITGSSQPLYLPGTLMVVTVALTYFLHKMKGPELRAAVRESSRILLDAGRCTVAKRMEHPREPSE